ncbi:MAG: hypothetical protein M1476_02510 [Candidatus Thermoplasmatota archaeon]|nr:hypothetical protein [Candidatus Thermoplasmatota archaeon]MCL5782766.1 hypothetical protein [Candidatus Thermoplasmatota archaeon]MCL6089439.1 hypothetical protein [Candidatus Thermoplasmatota archaeon]MDA8143469.1 hypothetical protein [Thermoplasmatales archaeon]
MKNVGVGKMKDVEKLSSEVVSMRKELDDVKEVLKGLIQVIMSREEGLDEDEYN